ncbi:MAG: hypothetical protein U5K72_02400 [Balneolaceae bacterium]|nr:hypothetical protein [Balneolaceae bacterium]
MKNQKPVKVLVLMISIMAAVAASMGIFSSGGPGSYEYESIRGETVQIYGEGLYRDMSADVAPQGIAQDYVTLFIAIPFLWISFLWTRNGSLKGRFLLAGTLGYFLVTYLFYLVMAMYNVLFLLYAALLGTSFFGFTLTMFSFDMDELPDRFSKKTPVKTAGGFLILNTLAIGILWLGVVVPPLLDGTIIPKQTEHYTTLIVQGLDLGLLLPIAFVTGVLFIQKKPMGFLLGPVYLVFLSILMTALLAKIIAMGLLGQNIIPVIFIIPTILLVSIACTALVLKNVE